MTNLKIAIEARALSTKGGAKTYVQQLIKHLLALGGENKYSIVTDIKSGVRDEVVVPLRHELLLPFWLQRKVPPAMEKLKPDVVHFTKADVPRHKVAPTVATIFDIIPLLFPTGQAMTRRFYWPGALKRAALLSDHIVTISKTSQRDIMSWFGVEASKVTVTPLAIDGGHFKPIDETARPQRPYVLFVGRLEPRKNVPLLIRAFARLARKLPHQLVIAGQHYSDYGNVMREIEVQRLGGRVKMLGFVAYDDLPPLYKGADLFVWPSVYEGWGLPAQEAMACGTPVVVSDGGALPEVVGNAGEIVPFSSDNLLERTRDTDFAERLAQKMLFVLNDQAKRREMSRTGIERVKQFSWQDVARRTEAVYRQLAG